MTQISNRLSALVSPPETRPLERLARLVVVAVLVGIGINEIYWATRSWPLHDMDVYLAAAQRIRDGQPLYTHDLPSYETYWYAPWFAFAWVPMTYLPRIVAGVLWSVILLAATAAVGLRLVRAAPSGWLIAALVLPLLYAVSAGGNVQPLMVLALMWGLPRRSGPLWVGLAASLKFTPVLFAAVYLARREWRRAAVTVVISALLVAPAIAGGLLNGQVASPDAPSLLGIAPPLYVAVVLVGAALSFYLARYSALVAATTAVLALPRLFAYDVTLLGVGPFGDNEGPAEGPASDG